MKAPRLFLPLFAATLAMVAPRAVRADDRAAAAAPTSPWLVLARGRVEPTGGIIQVASARDGIVKNVSALEGAHVDRDQVLAQLCDDTERLNLALAQKELAQAESALAPLQLAAEGAHRDAARLAPLAADRLATAADLEAAQEREVMARAQIVEAQQAVATAHARLDIAQHEVDARTVRAPASGRILRCLVKSGEAVAPQATTPLFWLAPDGPLTVRAQLDEDAARLVKPGQSAEIVPDASNQNVAHATVQSVGIVFGPRRPTTDDPAERQDVRIVDCVLVITDAAPSLLIGERVVVRFLRPAASSR